MERIKAATSRRAKALFSDLFSKLSSLGVGPEEVLRATLVDEVGGLTATFHEAVDAAAATGGLRTNLPTRDCESQTSGPGREGDVDVDSTSPFAQAVAAPSAASSSAGAAAPAPPRAPDPRAGSTLTQTARLAVAPQMSKAPSPVASAAVSAAAATAAATAAAAAAAAVVAAAGSRPWRPSVEGCDRPLVCVWPDVVGATVSGDGMFGSYVSYRLSVCVAEPLPPFETSAAAASRRAHATGGVGGPAGTPSVAVAAPRRYSEFVTLHEGLCKHAPKEAFVAVRCPLLSCLLRLFDWWPAPRRRQVPGLPPKKSTTIVSNFSDDFVGARQRALSLWLQHVTAHPALHKSRALAVFCCGASAAVPPATRETIQSPPMAA